MRHRGLVRLAAAFTLVAAACGRTELGGPPTPGATSANQQSTDAGVEVAVRPPPDAAAEAPPVCGLTGGCTSTVSLHSGALGGLAGADALCAAELPGSHFYRQSCDGQRNFLSSTSSGFADLGLGACYDCNGWTAQTSGPYTPTLNSCPTGYATVGGLLPDSCAPGTGVCWRLCQAVDHPLICCHP